MIRNLVFVSLAPILIVAIYIYLRDKYEKEPVLRLLLALAGGVIIIPAVLLVERFLLSIPSGLSVIAFQAYKAFIVAAFTEEAFKYMMFFLIIWTLKEFNEKFDGIVYAVYISLGFAAVENLIYVFSGGYQVGILRAFTAVPAHAFFGVSMGYHFGLARFYPEARTRELTFAFLFPFMWHGFYDFFLMTDKPFMIVMFLPLLAWLWVSGLKKMKKLSDDSFYRISGIGNDTNKANVSGPGANSGDRV